jgi:DNA-binding Lrp family transcriptional regulator
LETEHVQLPNYFKGITETGKQLDPTNIKILTAMWKHGPRNLLEISRRTRLPFTSVYHRVAKLEGKTGRVAYVMPETSKLGLLRVVVLAAATPGCEETVEKALQIPNLWRFINPSEGNYSTISAHAVPVKYLKQFNKYIRKLVETGLITRFKIIYTGDSRPNFPNFEYYDPGSKRWSFKWTQWLEGVKKQKVDRAIEDLESYRMFVDVKDLLIVKELEKNARKPLAEISPMLGLSVTAVKYRHDKLVSSGVTEEYALDVHAFPVEISAYHEVMLNFASSQGMNRFCSFLGQLPFVLSVAKVLKRNALLVRTYIPETQLMNMFTFLSQLTNAGFLTSYSSLRLNFAGRKTQTISYELYDDENGWMVNLERCASELTKLVRKRTVVMARVKPRTNSSI